MAKRLRRLNAKCGRLRVGREIGDRVNVSAAQVGDRQSAFGDVFEREVAVEIRRHNKELLEFDVTRCGSAESFAQTNFDIASAGEGEVSLDRALTIVRGVPSCTFRYKFARGSCRCKIAAGYHTRPNSVAAAQFLAGTVTAGVRRLSANKSMIGVAEQSALGRK